MKCKFSAKCSNEAAYIVVHKAAGAIPERRVEACRECAAKIGEHSPQGRVIDRPNMDAPFYRIEAI